MSDIKWDGYLATAYAEGFGEGEGATQEEQLEAWAYLVKTGLAWNLQGWFGRTASRLIEDGLITKDGRVATGCEDEDGELHRAILDGRCMDCGEVVE